MQEWGNYHVTAGLLSLGILLFNQAAPSNNYDPSSAPPHPHFIAKEETHRLGGGKRNRDPGGWDGMKKRGL